jgi:alanyl-tRNA synthetase
VVGGKAGGKAPTSVGNGTNVEQMDEAIKAATDYLGRLELR